MWWLARRTHTHCRTQVMEFDRVVFNEEPGAVYGPVQTNFGNHLIFLHSCRREGDIPVKRPGTPRRAR